MSIILTNLKDDLSKAMNTSTSLTFDRTTDSLEAIRDEIGSSVGASISADIAAVKTVVDAIGNTVSDVSTTTTGVIVEDGATGTPNVVTVVSSADAHTFGPWAQIDASVSANSQINSVIVHITGAQSESMCIEIGTGANSSEATKIRFSVTTVNAAQHIYVFPVTIPIKVASGTRVAARLSTTNGASRTANVSVQYYQSLE